MKKKVRVLALPKAVYGMTVKGKVNNMDGSQAGRGAHFLDGNASVPNVEVNRTIQPTARENATLEAEKGETVVTGLDPANSGGIPEFYVVGGQPHSKGGTPLNLPEDSFIFSQNHKMSISDPEILAQFGKNVGKKGKKKYTFADLSKQYDINKYRKVLADPSSDKFQIETAQMMIQNYNLKLGGLAMVQESMKGFPNGIPGVAMPYLEHVGMNPAEFFPQQQQQQQQPVARYGGHNYFEAGGPNVGEDVPPTDDFGETITDFNFSGVTNPAEYMYQISQTSSDKGIARDIDKTAFFNAWNQQPQAKDLQYQEVEGGWSTVPKQAPTRPAHLDKPFVPGFKYEDDKLFQKRQGRITGEEHWEASNPTMAKMYAKKYGSGELSGRELQQQITDNPEAFASSWGQAQIKDSQLAALTLRKMGGASMPYYEDGSEVNEANYTSFYDTTGIDAAANLEAAYMNQPIAYQQPVGTVPATASKSTKYQNIPSSKKLKEAGKAKWDVTAEGYNEAQVEPGDYVKKADGKWYEVKGYDKKNDAYDGTFKDERLIGKLNDNQKHFGRIQQRIDNNEGLRDAIVAQYRDEIAKAKPGKNLTEADLVKARSLSADDIVNNFYEFQKQIMAVDAHKGQQFNKNSDLWDKDRSQYENTITELGFDPQDPAHTAAFQATYIGMRKLAGKKEFKQDLEDFNIVPWGKADEKTSGVGSNISGIDGWVGDTTIGQGTFYHDKAKELKMEEAAWKEEQDDMKHLGNNRMAEDNPFWTEDLINIGGAARNLFAIKRYQPWNAVPGMKLPNATFQSPDQAIQNILSATKSGANNAGAFGSPQSFAANFAGIHNNSMQQVANAIGNVADRNVRVANMFETQRSQIMNRANERRATLATNLHDKNAIMNQQFDNAKTQAWNEVRKGIVNAWTNRGMTQQLNTFNDQYYTDARTGYKHFRNPRELTPKNSQRPDIAGQINDLVGSVRGLTADQAARIITKGAGNPAWSPTQGTGMDYEQSAQGYPGGVPNGYQG